MEQNLWSTLQLEQMSQLESAVLKRRRAVDKDRAFKPSLGEVAVPQRHTFKLGSQRCVTSVRRLEGARHEVNAMHLGFEPDVR